MTTTKHNDYVVRLEDVVLNYGETEALKGVTLDIGGSHDWINRT